MIQEINEKVILFKLIFTKSRWTKVMAWRISYWCLNYALITDETF